MRLVLAPILALLVLPLPRASARDEAPAADLSALVRGQTAFAVDLYRAVAAEEGDLFLSPYSVAAALGMVRLGAAGETARELDAALRLPSDGIALLAAQARALGPPRVRVDGGEEPAWTYAQANALWGQEGYPFEESFLARLHSEFRAALERVDFRNTSAARARINAWVEEQTRQRIQDLIPEGLPPPDTRLVLANALYLKAAWAETFSERGTAEAPFYGRQGEVRLPLMHRVASLGYAEDDLVQVVEIPYRSGDLAMVVILPRARDGLPALEARLDVAHLEGWLGRLGRRRVDLALPRFEITKGFDLGRALAALGIRTAFDASRADLSGMTRSEPLFLGVVLHKAFVKVDEAGTEAAAATAVVVRAGSLPPSEEPVPFRADHPFLFLIRHRPTGTVLFLGRLAEPAQP